MTNNNIITIYSNYINLLSEKYDIILNNKLYELLDNILNNMIIYIKTNILQIIYNDLYEELYEDSYELYYVQLIESQILEKILNISHDDSIIILCKLLYIGRSLIFKFIIPRRSYSNSIVRKNLNNVDYNLNINFNRINNQLNILKSVNQPDQRSDEWYIFRNSTLTASNIYKIFVSDYTQNQLILEKCEPLDINKFKTTNTNSPLHWGQKYEPVSIMYYEYINNTKVSEFGCIPHCDFSFIAASPDGIVCDPSSQLFGRMLEIKNVVSREITGIPKMEYWIQMQLQMEVCNLNECDFLETKFTEYSDYDDFINDNTTNYKGIILQYLKNEEPYYIYAPFMLNDINSNIYIDWLTTVEEQNKELIFINTLYWKLEVISCVLVLRNKFWFNTILPYIQIFWNQLVYERDSGLYKERISKKRKLKLEDEKSKSDFPEIGCLINI
tara:strand:- start:2254 stop:3579 length:1326 start_codon:yes stop_codon:yes gene_type:complete